MNGPSNAATSASTPSPEPAASANNPTPEEVPEPDYRALTA